MNARFEVRAGAHEHVLADVERVDSLVMDPPYSARTHEGRRTGSETRKSTITYEAITQESVRAFVASWLPRVREWWVVFGDDTSAQWWKHELGEAGLYVFAPLPWVKTDPTPRQAADGPASATEWIVVARTSTMPRRRESKPPDYRGPSTSTRGHRDSIVAGAKPLWLMRQLVADYTEPGDLVCDPFAGGGTTGVACVEKGRRFIGAELNEKRAGFAIRRITEAAAQQPLFLEPATRPVPVPLFDRETMKATRSRKAGAA